MKMNEGKVLESKDKGVTEGVFENLFETLLRQ